MSEYNLTADEVLYLAAMNGAEYFYGVPDSLSGLSDQELKMRVVEIEDSLNRKGYMQTDFDGNSQIEEKLVQMIDICAKNDGFLCFESETLGEPQTGCLYFIKDGIVYGMMPEKGVYTFREFSPESLETTVQKQIVWKETEEKEKGSFKILCKDLDKAAKLSGRGASDQARELLKEAGATEKMADTILEGFRNQADFYSVFFMNNQSEEEPGYGVQFLQGKLLVALRNETENDEDCVVFYVSDRKEQEALLAEGFRKLDFLRKEMPEKGIDFE